MKKLVIFFFLLTISSICNAQFSSLVTSKVVLKSGDTINNIEGKLKRKTFKYKTNTEGKAKEIKFSKIEYVQFWFSKDNIKTYNFFQFRIYYFY